MVTNKIEINYYHCHVSCELCRTMELYSVNNCQHVTGVPQEELRKRVHHKILHEEQKKETIKCGWYTERQMKETLKMSK